VADEEEGEDTVGMSGVEEIEEMRTIGEAVMMAEISEVALEAVTLAVWISWEEAEV
jgi:hypothetical protein